MFIVHSTSCHHVGSRRSLPLEHLSYSSKSLLTLFVLGCDWLSVHFNTSFSKSPTAIFVGNVFPLFFFESCLIHFGLLCIIDQLCHVSAGEDVKVDESLFQDLEDLDLEDEDLAELSDS